MIPLNRCGTSRNPCRWYHHPCLGFAPPKQSAIGPGKKVLFVDELWKFVDTNSLPAELERVARMGRSENLGLLSATQHPRDYHRDIQAEVTEWICFSMDEPGELDAVRPYFRGVDRVAQLPRGSFIAYHRESGSDLAGKLPWKGVRSGRADTSAACLQLGF